MSVLAVNEAIMACAGIIMMIMANFLAVLKLKGKMPDISRYLVPMSLAVFACAVLIVSVMTGILPIPEEISFAAYGILSTYFAFSFVYRLSDYILTKPEDTKFTYHDLFWKVM